MRSAYLLLMAMLFSPGRPHDLLAMQSGEEPKQTGVKSDSKTDGGINPFQPPDSIAGKVLELKKEQQGMEDAVSRVVTGRSGPPMSDEELRENEEFFDFSARSKKQADAVKNLTAQANAMTSSGAVVTLTWVLDGQKHYFVKVARGTSLQTTTVNLGDATDLRALNRFVSPLGVTLLEGDLPRNQSWHQWLKTTCRTCAISSRRSANRTLQERTFAALLGATVPGPKSTTIYNALPYEKDFRDSVLERRRMRISGSKEDWDSANERIRDALEVGMPGPDTSGIRWIAQKEPLLKDLRKGNWNVVLIFAHSDGNKIYMPGKSGKSISVEELRSVSRTDAPNRAVILIACDTGGVNQGTRSLAEAILESKLATTVFAYPGLISPSVVPDMLQGLGSGKSLRDALPGLYQIVITQGGQDAFYSSLHLRLGLLVKRG